MQTALLGGMGLGLSLIVAIGAQNAYLLQVGIAGHRVSLAIVVCIASDIALICAGVAGLSAVIGGHPTAMEIIKWIGVTILSGYALKSLWSARNAEAISTNTKKATSALAMVGSLLVITWLNPHTYVDTVLLLGSAATRYGTDRWWFAGGAVVASIVWFCVLGFGARKLSPVLQKPVVWRWINAVIGVILLLLAVRLGTMSLAG